MMIMIRNLAAEVRAAAEVQTAAEAQAAVEDKGTDLAVEELSEEVQVDQAEDR